MRLYLHNTFLIVLCTQYFLCICNHNKFFAKYYDCKYIVLYIQLYYDYNMLPYYYNVIAWLQMLQYDYKNYVATLLQCYSMITKCCSMITLCYHNYAFNTKQYSINMVSLSTICCTYSLIIICSMIVIMLHCAYNIITICYNVVTLWYENNYHGIKKFKNYNLQYSWRVVSSQSWFLADNS